MTFAPPTPDENGCCPTCGQPFTITAMSDALSAERARVIAQCIEIVHAKQIEFHSDACGYAIDALRALGQQDTGQS